MHEVSTPSDAGAGPPWARPCAAVRQTLIPYTQQTFQGTVSHNLTATAHIFTLSLFVPATPVFLLDVYSLNPVMSFPIPRIPLHGARLLILTRDSTYTATFPV
jgi:hypothetical protein